MVGHMLRRGMLVRMLRVRTRRVRRLHVDFVVVVMAVVMVGRRRYLFRDGCVLLCVQTAAAGGRASEVQATKARKVRVWGPRLRGRACY